MLNFISDENIRLVKKILKENEIGYSLTQKLLRGKDIKVNGVRVRTDILLSAGDRVEVFYDGKKQRRPDVPPDIIYEDSNIVVPFKGAGAEVTATDFSARINDYLKPKNETAAPCHRLDRNTEGLIIFSKNKIAADEFFRAFKLRLIKKYYLAAVCGRPKNKNASLKAYLYKDTKNSFVKISDKPLAGYASIQTAYSVKTQFSDYAVVEVDLISGKTHQIRAHLAHIGHPVLGDNKYGDKTLNKKFNKKTQALVAYRLVFNFESGSPLYYLNKKEITLPQEFIKI
jgi:23S rRNA pseudouridine955/2504/2580 synthase